MSEIEEKINSILSNPEELEKITTIAQSIMGGAGAKGNGEGEFAGASPDALNLDGFDFGSLDPNMIASLGNLISKAGAGDEKHALLEAMKPYLSQKRRGKMEKAMQIARMACLAGAAYSEFGGGAGE